MLVDNAGGSSAYSEAMSIHCFCQAGATDIVFEKDVKYWANFKMVDFICTLQKVRVGVSVTRAMGYPVESRFTESDAHRLLDKKLDGLIIARNGIAEAHSFFYCILHIWCQSERIKDLVMDQYTYFESDYPDVQVICTVSDDCKIYDE